MAVLVGVVVPTGLCFEKKPYWSCLEMFIERCKKHSETVNTDMTYIETTSSFRLPSAMSGGE